MKTQEAVFLEEQGDAYWERNKSLVHPFAPLIKRLQSLKGRRILEVGCSDGINLAELSGERYGIDPSRKAILHGSKKHPALHLRRATSDVLPYKDSFFDLVFFSFTLHWVDRSKLLQTISEADRVLQKGGHLLIMDFYPLQPRIVPYHHRKGVFTYKQHYGDIFSSTALYKRQKLWKFPYKTYENAHTSAFSTSTEPCAIEILRKV